jgi:hypothetical protein
MWPLLLWANGDPFAPESALIGRSNAILGWQWTSVDVMFYGCYNARLAVSCVRFLVTAAALLPTCGGVVTQSHASRLERLGLFGVAC